MTIKDTLKLTPVIGPIGHKLSGWFRALRGWLFWQRFYLRHRKLLKRNKTIGNSHRGERCFILATGPSIKTQNLAPLAGEFCISISNFFIHPDFKLLKPEFHLFVMSHSPITDEQWAAWMRDAEMRMPAGQKILAAAPDKYILDQNGLFKNQNVYYYQAVGGMSLRPRGTIDFTKILPPIRTSVQIAIYLALYAGATDIYLLGCDHNWILDLAQPHHFYEERRSSLVRAGYKEFRSASPKMETTLDEYRMLWKRYKNIDAYCQMHGVRVTNLTPESLLDIFPRDTLEHVIGTHP